MSTWGEACNDYIREKSFSAPPVVAIAHITRENSMTWRSEQRAFNPVLGVMIHPSVEARRRTVETDSAANTVAKGKEKALTATQHGYDIVTNKPRYGITEDVVKKMGGNQDPAGKKSERDRKPYVNYNILNNEVVTKWKHVQEAPERHKGMPEHGHTRDCNVVTHIFHKDHEKRKSSENEKIMRSAQALVANRLNPVVGQYYSVDLEEKERAVKSKAEAQLRTAVLVDHTFPVKGNLAKSEGRNYDIIQNKVLVPKGVEKFERGERDPVASKAALRQKWEWKRDVDEAMDALTRNRSLHRFQGERRLATGVAHGYDIVTTEPLGAAKNRPLLGTTLAQKLKTTEPPPVPRSDMIFAGRTRTTQEKVFQCPPSESLANAHSFEGRQATIKTTALPVINAATKRGPVRIDPLK